MTSTLHALGSLDAPVHARLEVAHRLLDLMDDVCVAAQRAAAIPARRPSAVPTSMTVGCPGSAAAGPAGGAGGGGTVTPVW
jgi:hypothetical protein